MLPITRELVAYGIIALIIAIGLPVLIKVMNKRKRVKLRRRGIKHYGH